MSNVITLNRPGINTVTETSPVALNANKNDDLNSLYQRIMGLKRQDYAIPANNLGVNFDDQQGFSFHAEKNGQSFEWKATDYALNQVSDRLSKGLRSFGQELSERDYNDFRASIVQEMLVRAPRDKLFQVRTIQPNGSRIARAVVSDRYKPIDDNLLIDPMLTLISDKSKDWRSLGGQLTDTHTRMRFITREPQLKNIGPNGRDWFVGFQYQNSEVGASKTGFSLFVFDNFCENGLVFGASNIFNCDFVHRGAQITSDFGLINEERVRQHEIMMIREHIIKATKFVLAQDFAEKIGEIVERNEARKLEGAGEQKLEMIKHLGHYAGLTKAECEAVVMHWDSREDSAFGVSHAITRLAQDKESYEARIRLEEGAGKLLSMDGRRWKSIVALAS